MTVAAAARATFTTANMITEISLVEHGPEECEAEWQRDRDENEKADDIKNCVRVHDAPLSWTATRGLRRPVEWGR